MAKRKRPPHFSRPDRSPQTPGQGRGFSSQGAPRGTPRGTPRGIPGGGPEATPPGPPQGTQSGRGGPTGPSYWIYGTHAALAALGNPARRIRRLALTKDASQGLAAELGDRGKMAEILDRGALERVLPPGAVHQGIALHVDGLDEPDLDEVLDGLAGAPGVSVLLLDQVTDPQNVGAVLRSAAAFGAAAVIVPRHHAPPMTGALAKAASGAVEHVPLVRVGNLSQAIERLKESDFWSVALEGEADQGLAEIDLTGRVALALGAEGAGLRRLTRERCDFAARLPTGGPIAQLNVSNAAAVALYECARQRLAAKAGAKGGKST